MKKSHDTVLLLVTWISYLAKFLEVPSIFVKFWYLTMFLYKQKSLNYFLKTLSWTYQGIGKVAPSPPWPRKPEVSLKSSCVSTSTLRPDLSEGGRGGLGDRIRDKPRLFKCYQPLISLDAWVQKRLERSRVTESRSCPCNCRRPSPFR